MRCKLNQTIGEGMPFTSVKMHALDLHTSPYQFNLHRSSEPCIFRAQLVCALFSIMVKMDINCHFQDKKGNCFYEKIK